MRWRNHSIQFDGASRSAERFAINLCECRAIWLRAGVVGGCKKEIRDGYPAWWFERGRLLVNGDERLNPADHRPGSDNLNDRLAAAASIDCRMPATAASAVEPPATKQNVAELRNHARCDIRAAQHALTAEFRRRFAKRAFRLAQRAEAMERGDISLSVADNSATELWLMTALHLRDRAAYCRRRAAVVGRPDVSGVLHLAAEDYENDAGRLEYIDGCTHHVAE